MLDQIKTLAGTVLAELPVPGEPQAPPGVGDKANTILAWGAWIVFALGIVGIFIVAGKMAVSNRRGEGGEHAASLGWVMGALILVSSAAGLVGWFAA